MQRDRLFADHRSSLHHFFRRLEFTLRIDDLGAPFALGLSLFGHCPLHAVRQRHVLDLHGCHFHPPGFGLAIDDFLQLLVDDIALREQVIQRGLAEHAAQRRLRHQRGGFEKVLHLHDGGLRIDDAEINNRIDRHWHVVTRHDLLLLDTDGDDAQIHPHHFINYRDEKNQSRPFGAQQFSQTKNHAALVFAQDANRLRQNDYGKNDEGYGPTN